LLLPHTPITEEYNAAAIMQEAASGELIHEAAIDPWLRRIVEIRQSFLIREAGKLQIETHGAAMAFLKFSFEQVTKEM